MRPQRVVGIALPTPRLVATLPHMDTQTHPEGLTPVPHPVHCPHGRVIAWRYADESLALSYRLVETCTQCEAYQ